MSFEIIDFHTHPFLEEKNNICSHKEFCGMSAENSLEIFRTLGVSKFCGSVVDTHNENHPDVWQKLRQCNDIALQIREIYGDCYIPGFHVHPGFVEESLEEIRRMDAQGVKLIGEVVPYVDRWEEYGQNYASEEFSVLLNEAGRRNMVVSFHSLGEDAMDKMVKKHPDVVFVAAHPGEYASFMRHLERMKENENYYLDLSGTGLFRYGMLRRAIDTVGADRILFGSDFPICNPAMFVGGVALDPLITDAEKEKILFLNAKRLLHLS